MISIADLPLVSPSFLTPNDCYPPLYYPAMQFVRGQIMSLSEDSYSY